MIFNRISLAFGNLMHRYRLSNLVLQSKGINVQISRGFDFICPERISIGDHVYIGPSCSISAIGGVVIKSGTIIGPRLTVYSANHNYVVANAVPYDDVVLPGKVVIGENTWIGGNVVIVPGVNIGEGCIIGAGSVVVKDSPPCSVLGGNPAKIIATRDETRYLELKAQGMIYLDLKNRGLMTPHISEVKS